MQKPVNRRQQKRCSGPWVERHVSGVWTYVGVGGVHTTLGTKHRKYPILFILTCVVSLFNRNQQTYFFLKLVNTLLAFLCFDVSLACIMCNIEFQHDTHIHVHNLLLSCPHTPLHSLGLLLLLLIPFLCQSGPPSIFRFVCVPSGFHSVSSKFSAQCTTNLGSTCKTKLANSMVQLIHIMWDTLLGYSTKVLKWGGGWTWTWASSSTSKLSVLR